MKRPFFHFLGGLIFPVIYYFNTRKVVLLCTLVLLIVILLFEWARKKYPVLNAWLFTYCAGFFKPQEKSGLTGMPFFVGGALITIALYDKSLAITALCFLTFGDVTAALVGKKYGKHKILAPKSLEGSMAFFLVTGAVGLFLKNYYFPDYLSNSSILIAAFIATLIESLPAYLDDNLTVPVLTGLALQLLRF